MITSRSHLWFGIITMLILIGSTSAHGINISSEKSMITHKNSMQSPVYQPRNITPANVSYHLSDHRFTIEWWYFEGIFSNGYNAVVNIILLSRKQIGLCFSHLNVFHENSTEDAFAERVVHPMHHFQGTSEYPNIWLEETPVVQFNETGYDMYDSWEYCVTYGLGDYAVNLTFIGETPGWEGPVLDGYYGPVLPIASVSGTLTICNETLNVSGLGYHEHAYAVAFPIFEWGWYWGKLVGANSSLFWGKMMNTRWDEQARAGVFSLKHDGYTNIDVEHISMELSQYVFESRRFIPTDFVFNVSDDVNQIYIDVTLTTKKIFYLPLGFFHYWRYLVVLNGTIQYQNEIENLVDVPQIMEVMRFR